MPIDMKEQTEALRDSGVKALVLLSGGIDSSTCLYMAADEFDRNVAGISVNYGQRHRKEMECAEEVCTRLGVSWLTIEMPSFPSKLTDEKADIPKVSYAEITGVSPTYVPFRNGLMIANLAALAHASGATAIYHGAHLGDAAGNAYPDCTLGFIGAMAAAVTIGTYGEVQLRAPIIELTKAQIISRGYELGVPYHLTWSCYRGGEVHCGECPTCIARHQGFVDAGFIDPTTYAVQPKPEHD